MLLKFCCMLVLYALVLVTTACPVSAASIEKLQGESKKTATYANAGVNVTRTLFEGHLISLAQKDQIAKSFITLADGGIALDATLADLKTQYGENVPQDQITAVANIFNANVVDRFLNVLLDLKVITAKSQFASTIELLRTSVLAIATVLKIKSAVRAKLATAS